MKALLRWLLWLALAAFCLQLFFIARIALMCVLDPESTSFQRSQMWQLAQRPGPLRWQQQWAPENRISDHLKRAVIAAEDSDFPQHDGVDWAALEKAWQKNAQAEQRALQQHRPGAATAKVVGGSTITQQLAKNLFLSGERTLWRKGQEFVLTLALELLLDKSRILTLYLNNVEWGEGVFGAEAAARHYFQKSAAELSPWEAARLAVMLPRPRYFEKLPQSAYLSGRAEVIRARMFGVDLP